MLAYFLKINAVFGKVKALLQPFWSLYSICMKIMKRNGTVVVYMLTTVKCLTPGGATWYQPCLDVCVEK